MPFASGARVAGGLYHHNYASGGADGGRRLRPHRPQECGGAGENVIRLANAENISASGVVLIIPFLWVFVGFAEYGGNGSRVIPPDSSISRMWFTIMSTGLPRASRNASAA